MYDYIKNQPIINIGCLGSVSDGKSTLIKVLTGIKTQKHSNELIKNITIKQGYANMKIWETNNDESESQYKNNNYITTSSNNNLNNKLVNHISFVDCPGHQDLTLTMLSSINLMDGAIIVIAVDQPISKKPQLYQHLVAAKIGKIDKLIICLNKIDLVEKYTLLTRKKELDVLLEKLNIKPFIIIPTSFNKRIGINYLVNSIMKLFNPEYYLNNINNKDEPFFRISRSFDINKPGTDFNNITGGVIGGSLMSGNFNINDEIEIRPGIINNNNNKIEWQPIKTKILSIKTDDEKLDKVVPGGLIGLLTDIDPFYCKNDNLSGNIVGLVDKIPNVYIELTLKINIINIFDYIWKPNINDIITLQIGITSCTGKINKIIDNIFDIELFKPVCIKNNQHIIICFNINNILCIVGESYL